MIKNISVILFFTQLLFSFTIDRKVSESDAFIFTSHYEVPYLMGYALMGTVLIEGNSKTRFGKTTMKALDSFIWANLGTEAFKKTFRRVRPRNAKTSNEWFQDGHNSFFSGHVASVTASVTPYIFEYQNDYPWVRLLWFFPIQQMAGRVNAQAHWQTDVLAGAIFGTLVGCYSHSRETPLFLYFDGDGIYTGLKYRF